ncbi:hypothetical protein ACIHFD_49630 [Nonomuraea sp. NPDC051941]|uniref:hypothetical protein n=1 Tax=Nonomuraea sp. NPDC051941 TaxID=3364373 RepID=UPI0037C56760
MKHQFKLDEDGEVDLFAVANDWEFHNGPWCLTCKDTWCVHCHPERSLEEECPGWRRDDCSRWPTRSGKHGYHLRARRRRRRERRRRA